MSLCSHTLLLLFDKEKRERMVYRESMVLAVREGEKESDREKGRERS